MYVCLYVCVYMYVCVCLCMCICMCMCLYVYVYVLVYVEPINQDVSMEWNNDFLFFRHLNLPSQHNCKDQYCQLFKRKLVLKHVKLQKMNARSVYSDQCVLLVLMPDLSVFEPNVWKKQRPMPLWRHRKNNIRNTCHSIRNISLCDIIPNLWPDLLEQLQWPAKSPESVDFKIFSRIAENKQKQVKTNKNKKAVYHWWHFSGEKLEFRLFECIVKFFPVFPFADWRPTLVFKKSWFYLFQWKAF